MARALALLSSMHALCSLAARAHGGGGLAAIKQTRLHAQSTGACVPYLVRACVRVCLAAPPARALLFSKELAGPALHRSSSSSLGRAAAAWVMHAQSARRRPRRRRRCVRARSLVRAPAAEAGWCMGAWRRAAAASGAGGVHQRASSMQRRQGRLRMRRRRARARRLQAKVGFDSNRASAAPRSEAPPPPAGFQSGRQPRRPSRARGSARCSGWQLGV